MMINFFLQYINIHTHWKPVYARAYLACSLDLPMMPSSLDNYGHGVALYRGE